MSLKILFIGDIVGKIGRKTTAKVLPELKKKYKPDLIIANGENATHGNAITLNAYTELKKMGIDFFTLGDHTFKNKENLELLTKEKTDVIRPANYPPNLPGKGYQLIEVGTKKILIINLLGRVFMKFDYDCPFRTMAEILEQYQDEKLAVIIVDFHAEATSEKNAFALYFDGKISAILGTHTHIPTCDQRILPSGTAYITDVGMVGAKDSVIGAQKESVIKMFLYQYNLPIEPEEDGPAIFNACLIEIDTKTKLAKKIKRVDREIDI
jgi:metallophosphoesterase (TIGR00282 family)